MQKIIFLGLAAALFWASCQSNDTRPSGKRLPILGNRDISPAGDTIYPTIPDFRFINQNGDTVTNATFAGKAYVVDFFFIHCPTICPKVKKNALMVYQHFLHDDRVAMLSHSIDVRNDTVAALKRYADKLGIAAPKWHLVTGDHDQIFGIADDYFSVATENPEAPGGFDHSGRLILVDKHRHVRAFCDGTDAESVRKFIGDVETLLREY